MKLKSCTPEEYDAFIKAYPNPLDVDVYRAVEPPLLSHNDFTRGVWPESMVATCMIDDYLEEDPAKFRFNAKMPQVKESNWRILK